MAKTSAFDMQTMKYDKDRHNLTLFPTFHENIYKVSCDGVRFISFHEIILNYMTRLSLISHYVKRLQKIILTVTAH